MALFAMGLNSGQSADSDKTLDSILDKAGKYCLRLDKAALDFVCREEVKERANILREPVGTTVLPQIDPSVPYKGGMGIKPPPPADFRTTTYVYDYQFIRKGGDVKERRNLMRKDGEEVTRKDARIETRHFKFRDILFGPSLLLGETEAGDHVYNVLKKDKVKGQETAVIACEARPESAGRVLTGRAWVRLTDGAVLRISWDPESFSGYQDVLAVAKELGMSPAIKSETEFGVERNGLRFPSLDKTEEIYKSGTMTFTRSITTIKYAAYKFFTVETAYEISRG
ncbi:MAG: hypothetical protein OEW18_04065 [Candidatus Aminicenantes bacterium]|nr:hypothetical protein [Candidatus Aminicenantes bacterium]